MFAPIRDEHWHLFELTLQGIWHLITQVHNNVSYDIWVRSSSPNDICSFASSWNAVRDVAPVFPLSNLVWQPNACPKMSACFLRALQGKLLT